MSQPAAVASASFARSSPRCQLWTSLPRFPSGFSRLWSGPATKPSSEIDMWQVVSGIGVLQVIAICKRRHRTAHRGFVGRSNRPPVVDGSISQGPDACPSLLERRAAARASTKGPVVGNDLVTVIEDLIDQDSEVLKASSELLHGR